MNGAFSAHLIYFHNLVSLFVNVNQLVDVDEDDYDDDEIERN